MGIHKSGWSAFKKSVNRGYYGRQNLLGVAVVGNGKVVNSSDFRVLVSKSEVVGVGVCSALKFYEFADGTIRPFADKFKAG